MNKDLFKTELLQSVDEIWEENGLPEGNYDAQAAQYDKLVSGKLYNKIMWGNSPCDYEEFAKTSLQKCEKETVVDIGCGSLTFTHHVYAESRNKELILSDLSSEILHIAKKRLQNHQRYNSAIEFLRADALQTPFKDNVLENILSFGILHIFAQPEKLLQEFHRILKKEGKLFLTSLCTDRKISAKYLHFLQKKGHVAEPLHSSEIMKLIKTTGFEVSSNKTRGGMLYLSVIKKTD